METSEELNIGRYLRLVYKKRYLFVAVMVLVTTAVTALGYLLPRKYEATSMVLIERNFLNDLLKGITVSPSIDDRVKAVSAIMKSRPLVMKVMRDLDLDLAGKTEAETEKLIKTFQETTDIKIDINKSNRRDMDMFTVSLKHPSPAVARDYVNTLVRRYIEESISSKREDTYGASKFLTEQVELFKEKINAIEANMAGLKKDKVTAVQLKATNTQMRLILLQKRLDDLLLQYTPKHPEVEKARDELESLKLQMKGLGKGREVSEGQYNAMSNEQTALGEAAQKAGISEIVPGTESPAEKGESSGAGATSSTANWKSRKLAELERDREMYQKIYQEMVAAQGKSEVSSHIEVQDKGGTLRIIEPAVLPHFPSSPDRVKMILLGLLAGVGAGIGLIILLDSLDKSVKTLDALNAFGIPVLAVIPHIQAPAEIRKTRNKDLVLYVLTGIYLTGVAAVLTYELHIREMI